MYRLIEPSCYQQAIISRNRQQLRECCRPLEVIMIFLPRDAMHKRGLCRHAVSVCLSACLSVCMSVTFVNCVKTNKHIIKKSRFSPNISLYLGNNTT